MINRNKHVSCIEIPEGAIIIGDKAFAECANLRLIRIPSTVNTIGQNAFEGDSDMMLSVVPGSYAESWAVGKGLPYVAEN